MKKGYLKTLAALATGSLLLSMSLSAFAAPRFNVTTTYGSDGMVDVTVSDISAGAGDEVAFLAEKGSEIVYIDQKTADTNGSVANFTFKLTEAQATGETQTKLRVGSTTMAADATGKVVELAGKTVTLAVADPATGYVEAASQKTYANTLNVYVVPAAGYKLASYKVGSGTPVTEFITTSEGAVTISGITDTCTVTFTFTAATAGEVTETPSVPAGSETVATKTETTKEAAVIAKATGATEYGILVAETAEAINEVDDVSALTPFTAVKKFVALAADYNGIFGVNVQDALVEGVYNHFDRDTYYYSIYAQGTNLKKSAPVTFTFAQ